MRLGAGRDLPTGSFVPRIIRIVSWRIVIAWVTQSAGSDALLQFFDLDQDFSVMSFIHMLFALLLRYWLVG